jgi:hypothetical protein
MEIILEEGEVLCSSCKGRGYHPSKQNPDTMASVCRKCNGDRKIDWITNAMGIQKRPNLYGSSSYGFSSTSGYGIGGRGI